MTGGVLRDGNVNSVKEEGGCAFFKTCFSVLEGDGINVDAAAFRRVDEET